MVLYKKNKLKTTKITILYENPVNYEDVGFRGVSHVLEHMICKSCDDLLPEFERNFIENNASTGMNAVKFYISGYTDVIKEYLEDYVKRITTYIPTEAHFEKERAIVIQEYQGTFSSDTQNFAFNMYRKYFDSYAPIGDIKDLAGLTFDMVMEFHSKYFSKPTKIAIVSDSEFDLDGYDIESAGSELKDNDFDVYDFEIEPFNIDSNSELLGCISDVNNRDNLYYLDLITVMLSTGLTSPFYKEIREKKQLCYWLSCSANKNGSVVFETQASPEHHAEIKSIFLSVLSNPKKYLTEQVFNSTIKSLRIKLKLSMENVLNTFDSFIEDYVSEKYVAIKNLDTMTYLECMEYYNKYVHPDVIDYVFFSHSDLLK